MAKEERYYMFKLLGNKKPISFELPISSQMFIKKDENGNSLGKKKIHYIKGAPSIFVEDYKGDEKGAKVFFEDGLLKVDREDVNLVKIVSNHKWRGTHYELIDENKQALEKLSKNALVKQALAKVDISNEFELKAHGIILIGPHIASWTEPRVKAALEDKAFNEPKELLEEMNTGEYRAKYIGSLAILREVLFVNPGNTAVLWASGDVLVHVPLGKDPIKVLGIELSKNTESTRVTLQEIDLAIKRSYNKSYDATAEKEVADLTNDISKKDLSLDDDNSFKEDLSELEIAQSDFKELIGSIPNNKKNDLEWLKSKIEEAKANS